MQHDIIQLGDSPFLCSPVNFGPSVTQWLAFEQASTLLKKIELSDSENLDLFAPAHFDLPVCHLCPLDSPWLRWCAGEQKAAVSDSGYSQIAGDTPATTGVQPTRSEVLAGDGVQLLNCLMRQLKGSASNVLSQVFHWWCSGNEQDVRRTLKHLRQCDAHWLGI